MHVSIVSNELEIRILRFNYSSTVVCYRLPAQRKVISLNLLAKRITVEPRNVDIRGPRDGGRYEHWPCEVWKREKEEIPLGGPDTAVCSRSQVWQIHIGHDRRY